VDAAAAAVHAVVVVALAVVAPVGDVDGPLGAVGQGDAAEPGVVAGQEVGGVAADVAAAAPVQHVAVDAVAVEVTGEEAVAVEIGPVVAEVEHAAGVGVAAAGDAVDAPAAARTGPVAAAPVEVVGGGVDQVVGVAVVVLAVHALVAGAGDHV